MGNHNNNNNNKGGRSMRNYSRGELERLKPAFESARMRTCLTPSGKEVFERGFESAKRMLEGHSNSNDVQNVNRAEDLLNMVHNDRERGRKLGLIRPEHETKIVLHYGQHDRDGHGGHGHSRW